METLFEKERIQVIYGRELLPSVPAMGKFALEFAPGGDCRGYFHLFFKSDAGINQCIMSGDVCDRDGSHEFLPYSRENHDGGVIPQDQRLLRLLNIFSREVNRRRRQEADDIDQALDEIFPVCSWRTA